MPPKSPTQNFSRPGLRQVADAAGVSAMTVSRALRNHPHVKPAVTQRVLKAAADVGYTQNPAMSKLMVQLRQHRKSRYHATIAALTTIPADIEPHPPRFVREGARLGAERLGYRLELFRLKSLAAHDARLERTLTNRGIEGVILLPMVVPSKVDTLLDWRKFSVVAATSSIVSPDFMQVGANYYHNARMLCAELIARGYRKAGYVGTRSFGVRTNDAFIAAAAAMALQCGESPVCPFMLENREIERAVFRSWLAREKPDVVIACAQEFVPRIRRELDAGRHANTPVVCTSIDPKKPPCSGIDECHELIGRNAVETLAGMLNRNEKNLRTTQVRTLIEGRWFELE